MLRTYYLDKLAASHRDAYYAVDGAVRSYRNECMLYGLDEGEAREVLAAYTYDNPDAWFCALQFFEILIDQRGVRVRLTYNELDEGRFNEKLSSITSFIDSKVGPYTSEEELAKLIYDYLCSNVEADTEAVNLASALDRRNEHLFGDFIREHGASFCAYGALVNGKAACMGIASAYKLLLDIYRIEAACVPGTYASYPHMINVLEFNGVRTFVDVSRGLKVDSLPMVRYDYFCVNEERIRLYFAPNEDFECVSDRMSYFARNGIEFKDGASLRRYLSSFSYSRIKGDLRFLYSSNVFDDDDLEKMIDDIVSPRCGTEYKIVGYIAENGVGNCKMNKLEE